MDQLGWRRPRVGRRLLHAVRWAFACGDARLRKHGCPSPRNPCALCPLTHERVHRTGAHGGSLFEDFAPQPHAGHGAPRPGPGTAAHAPPPLERPSGGIPSWLDMHALFGGAFAACAASALPTFSPVASVYLSSHRTPASPPTRRAGPAVPAGAWHRPPARGDRQAEPPYAGGTRLGAFARGALRRAGAAEGITEEEGGADSSSMSRQARRASCGAGWHFFGVRCGCRA